MEKIGNPISKAEISEKTVGYLSGIVLLLTVLVLVVVMGPPNYYQWIVFKILLALGSSGIGGILTGNIQVQGAIQKVKLQAGGGLAIFVIVFIYIPETPPNDFYALHLTEAKYIAILAKKETEIQKALHSKTRSEAEQSLLESELIRVREDLEQTHESYKNYVKEQEVTIARIDKLKGIAPLNLIIDAKAALAKGNMSLADKLFSEIEKDAEIHIKAAAESAYQRGLIAFSGLKYRNALEHYERAFQLGPDVAAYAYALGGIYYELGQQAKAIYYYEQTILTNSEKKESSIALENIHYSLGLAWYKQGNYDKSIGYYDKALERSVVIYGEESREVARILGGLGLAWHQKGEFNKAIRYLDEALLISEQINVEFHPDVARDLNGLAIVWADKGDYNKAIGYLERALTIDLTNFNEDHPKVITRRHNLGQAWHAKGQHNKALEYYEPALSSAKTVWGDAHPNLILLWRSIGRVWHDQGELEKAFECYERSLISDPNTSDKPHPNVATTHAYMAEIFVTNGQYDIAINHLEKALDIDLNTLGEIHSYIVDDLYNLAHAFALAGEFDEAINSYEKAIITTKAVYGDNDPTVATIQYELDSLVKAIKRTP
ncbi:tetratricopeptide repeat protein [Vibrio crassostreae]|uniref:tetratricopeptide repeat protein n=1 Tax=Vibrio crassostreae TaxID=246167 RepID=UPI001B302781|nr:tetratricopeptide repeat protein [Vibrio crassostreae]CAK2742957.1 Tetratricopeptide repeat protein [Vibrio crassostreae]